MSTTTYNEAAEALGVSRSTIERRIRLTGVPVEHRGGRAYIDLDTLADAWRGRREASTTLAPAALSASIREDQRYVIDQMAQGTESVASVVRHLLDLGMAADDLACQIREDKGWEPVHYES